MKFKSVKVKLVRSNFVKVSAQRGVVLFIALIALVVMSLAAVALIRSVDTNTMIAGNLALKHSALAVSDRGVETAMSWMKDTADVDATKLDIDDASKGYYATYLTINLDDSAVLKNKNTWTAAVSAVAVGAGIVGGEETDTKNEIRYIIQRMCRQANIPANDDATNRCLFGDNQINTKSNDVVDATGAGAKVYAQSPMYRITTRVAGPKNTFSYAQTFVY